MSLECLVETVGKKVLKKKGKRYVGVLKGHKSPPEGAANGQR